MAIYRDYDQAALDRQYDTRSDVPDYQAFFDRWAADSTAVRAAAGDAGLIDVAYGPGPRDRLDIFPAGADAPVLAFIHGGYWRAFDKSYFSFLAPAINAAGATLVTIGYPLAPAVAMDDIVDAVRRAFIWLWREGAGHGIAADRLHVTGHSAGGHLTAETMSTDWAAIDAALPADLVKAGLAVSGLYDLEPIRLCYLNPEVRLDAEMARRNSPIHHVPRRAGPLTVTVGGAESDEFHRQQADYAAAWRAGGHDLSVVDAPGHNHFTIVDLLTDPASGPFRALMRMMGIAEPR